MASSLRAPPPKAPQKEKEKLTKAPPENLDKPEQETKPRQVSINTGDSRSEECEAWGEMQEGPIGIDQYGYATGAQIRMENAIAEGKDAIGRKGTLGNEEARKQSRS